MGVEGGVNTKQYPSMPVKDYQDATGKLCMVGVSEPVGKHNQRYVEMVRWLRSHEFRIRAALKAVHYRSSCGISRICADNLIRTDAWKMVFSLLRQAGFYGEKATLSRDNFMTLRDATYAACGKVPETGFWKRRPDVY